MSPERRPILGQIVIALLAFACGPSPEPPDPPAEARPEESVSEPIEVLEEASYEPPRAATPPLATPSQIYFVVDSSGSMKQEIEGTAKIDTAKTVLAEWIGGFPRPSVQAGLVAYGHRRREDCEDIEELVPLGPFDAASLVAGLESIVPRGETPMAASVEFAVRRLREQGMEGSVVLVSDGEDTCHAEPCGLVRELRAAEDFVLHVIGFDIGEEDHALQLRCMAEAGGGFFATAANIDELKSAVDAAAGGRPLKVQQNVEIILDTSRSMLQVADGTSRLEKASEALQAILEQQVQDRDNLAFRRFGGACGAGNTELAVEFSQSNAAEIRGAIRASAPRGDSDLVQAVTQAAYDFDDPARFEGVDKRVLVMIGSLSTCFYRDPLGTIRQRLANREIKPDFTFLGIDVPVEQQARLAEITEATGGEIFFEQDSQAIEDRLQVFFEDGPVVRNASRIVLEVLNPISRSLNAALLLVDERKYGAAEEELRRARDLLEADSTGLALRDLERRRQPQHRRLAEITGEVRRVQKECVRLAEELLRHSRLGDLESFDRAADAYDERASELEQLGLEGTQLLNALRASLAERAGAVSLG